MTRWPKHHERLPSYQLALAVDRLILKADMPRIVFGGQVGGSNYSSGPMVREGLGINERIHYGWRTGGRPSVGIEVADEILLKAGLLWWDVWNEDTVRRPLLLVKTYAYRRVRRGARHIRIREPRLARRYGDRGPDFDQLTLIRELWEPPMEEAVTNREMLAEFHKVFGGPGTLTNSPTLRASLHAEEHEELLDALDSGDRERIARELADLVYVAYGTALVHGIDLDAAVREVHSANMSKLGDDGQPIRREDGKVLKGPGFRPPNMRAALEVAA